MNSNIRKSSLLQILLYCLLFSCKALAYDAPTITTPEKPAIEINFSVLDRLNLQTNYVNNEIKESPSKDFANSSVREFPASNTPPNFESKKEIEQQKKGNIFNWFGKKIDSFKGNKKDDKDQSNSVASNNQNPYVDPRSQNNNFANYNADKQKSTALDNLVSGLISDQQQASKTNSSTMYRPQVQEPEFDNNKIAKATKDINKHVNTYPSNRYNMDNINTQIPPTNNIDNTSKVLFDSKYENPRFLADQNQKLASISSSKPNFPPLENNQFAKFDNNTPPRKDNIIRSYPSLDSYREDNKIPAPIPVSTPINANNEPDNRLAPVDERGSMYNYINNEQQRDIANISDNYQKLSRQNYEQPQQRIPEPPKEQPAYYRSFYKPNPDFLRLNNLDKNGFDKAPERSVAHDHSNFIFDNSDEVEDFDISQIKQDRNKHSNQQAALTLSFEDETSTLTSDSQIEMKNFISSLNRRDKVQVVSFVEENAYNHQKRLSLRRAIQTRNLFLENGVDSNNIEIKPAIPTNSLENIGKVNIILVLDIFNHNS